MAAMVAYSMLQLVIVGFSGSLIREGCVALNLLGLQW